jgi:superfamily II DNA or RNA helicase
MKNLPYQDEAVRRFRGKRFFGLLFDCGTGKTRTGIKIAEADMLLSEKKYKAVLVITPRILEKDWADMINLHKEQDSQCFVTETTRMHLKGVQKKFKEFLCRNLK